MKVLNGLEELEQNGVQLIDRLYIDSKDKGVKMILQTLKQNYKRHQKIIHDMIDLEKDFSAKEETYDKNIFRCLEDCECAYLSSNDIKAYIQLADMEKDAIKQYKEALTSIRDDQVKEILKYILKKHKDSLFVLEDMIKLINRPNEWVESAEFTIREPY